VSQLEELESRMLQSLGIGVGDFLHSGKITCQPIMKQNMSSSKYLKVKFSVLGKRLQSCRKCSLLLCVLRVEIPPFKAKPVWEFSWEIVSC